MTLANIKAVNYKETVIMPSLIKNKAAFVYTILFSCRLLQHKFRNTLSPACVCLCAQLNRL